MCVSVSLCVWCVCEPLPRFLLSLSLPPPFLPPSLPCSLSLSLSLFLSPSLALSLALSLYLYLYLYFSLTSPNPPHRLPPPPQKKGVFATHSRRCRCVSPTLVCARCGLSRQVACVCVCVSYVPCACVSMSHMYMHIYSCMLYQRTRRHCPRDAECDACELCLVVWVCVSLGGCAV